MDLMVQNRICQAAGDRWLWKLTDRRFPFLSWRTGMALPAIEADGLLSDVVPDGRWRKRV